MQDRLKIVIIGGGPGGLYFANLMKLANPDHDITIYEQNRAKDTFGFGVVFSDETLGNFTRQDPETYKAITEAFAYWDEIEVRYRGRRIRSGGHGFCGMARITLLNILQARAEQLGVKVQFQDRVESLEQFGDADVIIGADGLNSVVREGYQEHFGTTIDYRKTKFVWLGTTQTFDAFTFIFKENDHGWFYNHAYQYGQNQYGESASTWILETHENTWRRAGLDQATEQDTIDYFADFFEEELEGHPILSNMSVWRNFPMLYNERLVHKNIALIGDAAHTAQFSIGSGTKLAMEDSIALTHAFEQHGGDVKAALLAYEQARADEVARLQRTAVVSLEWYENALRYNVFEPEQYAFSFLTRSKSVTYENLKMRDSTYGASVDQWWAEKLRKEGFDVPHNDPPPPMLTPFKLRDMVLQNRVMVSPMCQYSAEDGSPNDWQLVHLGGFAVGGAGLVYTEMTDVSREGRITPGCAGMYKDGHIEPWKRVVEFVHANSAAKICMQLAHAGPKASTKIPWQESRPDDPLSENESWEIIAASPTPYRDYGQVPKEMNRSDMNKVRDDFVAAAERAEVAGFDMIEVHMAHGYLLSSFISPLLNKRTDEYGGSLENRMRYPLEIFDAVRAVWPMEKPMSVRISATDWVEDGGLNGDDAVEIAKMFKEHGLDILDVSAGQTSTDAEPIYGRMFQTPFSDQVRQEVGIPTIAVGNITTADQINTIVTSGRADICALARPHLLDPHFTLRAAARYGYEPQNWPNQYLSAKPQAETVALRDKEMMSELREAAKPRSHRRQAAE